MEKKIYHYDLSREHAVCCKFYDLSEQHDQETYNIANNDVPDVIDQLKGFVKEVPRFLEPYLWLEELYCVLDAAGLVKRSIKKPVLKRFKWCWAKKTSGLMKCLGAVSITGHLYG